MRVTHPFHPLYGRDFEFVAHRQNWGEDQVHLHDENGRLFSLPAGWTDVAAPDLQYWEGDVMTVAAGAEWNTSTHSLDVTGAPTAAIHTGPGK